ncbi:MAG TPA: I78 family peptidase inhibitor, partial [Ramlibacter sp.]
MNRNAMHRQFLLSSLFAAALLAGCVQPPQSGPLPGTPPGACNAQAAQFAVGYTSTEALAEEVRRRSGAKFVRVLRPGQVTTM